MGHFMDGEFSMLVQRFKPDTFNELAADKVVAAQS